MSISPPSPIDIFCITLDQQQHKGPIWLASKLDSVFNQLISMVTHLGDMLPSHGER